jgi:predicted transcriptional regulator
MYIVPMDGHHHEPGSWTFLTNHSHVLLCLYKDHSMTMKDIAVEVGITERAVQRIVADLHAAGYIEIKRNGRQNNYSIGTERKLRHPLEKCKTVGDLIDIVYSRETKGIKQK